MKTEICGQYIFDHREKIISDWEKIASLTVTASSKTSNLVLRDHLPHFIENLSDILLSIDTEVIEKNYVEKRLKVEFSKQHGRARASTPHYDIGQLTHEYIILRNVIVECLAKEKILDLNSAEVISVSVEWSSLEACRVFMESIQEMQEKLVGSVAHDLRNPISTAYSAAEHLEGTSETESQVVGLIKRGLGRSLTLLDELLDSAQLVAGEGMTFRFESFDLAAEIRDAADEASKIYTNSIIFPSSLRPMVGTFDRMALRRVVENLISNAIKYGGASSPISIDFQDSKDFFTLQVNNKGSYIPKEEQENIFDFFKRQDSESTKGKQGWGLGLALVKMVAKAHKGEAGVTSSKEDGTTFYLKLARDVHAKGTTFSQCL